jgi:hypothetical protein
MIHISDDIVLYPLSVDNIFMDIVVFSLLRKEFKS